MSIDGKSLENIAREYIKNDYRKFKWSLIPYGIALIIVLGWLYKLGNINW